MKKKELFKKCQEIMLETNGGNEDYAVALCKMSNLIAGYANEKDQRIAELEEELELKNHTIEFLESQRDNAYKDYRELEKTIKQTQLDWVQADKNLELAKNYVKDLQKENAKLQEQLKNAIIPKFKVGDEVFVNLTDMDFVKKTFCLKISGIDYRYILETRPYGRFDERDLFDTQAEAQKYSESLKNDQ